MIVRKTSVFPAGRGEIFEKLRQPETLRYIAAPYAAFAPVDTAEEAWRAGGTYAFRLKLFGLIPLGIHTIRIMRFDPEGISSREGNAHVPVWNHEITLRPLEGGRTEYTDRVEIRAGGKTFAVWLWANAFYAHRQRRWIGLLSRRE